MSISRRIVCAAALVLISRALFAQSPVSPVSAPSQSSEPASGGRGGGPQADFDTLIDLIKGTVAPDTWDDVGGNGSVEGFPGGVYVDTDGLLTPLDQEVQEQLRPVWKSARQLVASQQQDRQLRRSTRLRKVSLHRLHRALRQRERTGLPPTPVMRLLAGLQRIDYVVVDPDRCDLVLIGPAGPWQLDGSGRIVGHRSGRPLQRLDDWTVLLRNSREQNGQFLCAITPTDSGLAKTQAFLAASVDPLPAGGRQAWLEQLRSAMGPQRIQVQGIPPQTRVARVMVEADYHMKQIGIGLAPGVDGVTSYLDRLELDAQGKPPAMDVLRWWFTLEPRSLRRSVDGRVYALARRTARVRSENERLTQQGRRVHTGEAEPLNRAFAQQFTEHLPELANRYPIYADLDNIFRLAIVAAIFRQETQRGQWDWSPDIWIDPARYRVPQARVAQAVTSLVNYRQLDRRTFVAVVSGGVEFRAASLFQQGTIPPFGPFETADVHAATASDGLSAREDSAVAGEIIWWWD